MNRVIPGILMVTGWLLLLFLGTVELFWGIAILGTILALHEFFRMVMPKLSGMSLYLVIGCCQLPVLATYFGRNDVVLAGVMFGLLAIAALGLYWFGKVNDVLGYVTACGFSLLYIALCLAHIALIRHLPDGEFWLTMLVGIVAGSDTGAYYAGRAFGKRKLFPVISPKKTGAGVIGGCAGVIAAEIINLLLLKMADPLVLAIAATGLVGIGIAGDLTESMIKRSAGVKDSGTILFGHGGILDRIDSLLLAGPVLYYLLYFGIL